ncbi:MAG: penicillin-binding transpeptidase domain-containing protein, partial [Planctomycetota bacterium]
LAAIQLVRGDEFRRKAADRVLRTVGLETTRGSILDTNGVALATSKGGKFSIAVRVDQLDALDDPAHNALFRQVTLRYGMTQGEILDRIAAIRKDIRRSVQRDVAARNPQSDRARRSMERWLTAWYERRPQPLLSGVSFPDAMAVELDPDTFPSLVVLADDTRRHPLGLLASHVLGDVSPIWKENWQDYQLRYPDDPRKQYRMDDLFGASGLELAREDQLRGSRGRRTDVVDSRGRVHLLLRETPPIPGKDLQTTIDCRLQRAAETALKGQKGAAVVLDPTTGDVLCLASSPLPDPQDPDASRADQAFLRRATSGLYPPGSTYKIFVAAAGLQSERITPDTFFTCDHRYRLGGQVFGCLGYHGALDLEYALAKSCNIYFYQAGERIGPAEIERWTRAFGFGEKTGIEIGEETGIAFGPSWKRDSGRGRWFPGDTANLAIGQGPTLVTPLQMARAVAAIANGGRLLRPHLASADGSTESFTTRTLPLSDDTIRFLRRAMASVVKFGTAHDAFEGFPVPVAGKTGTAETSRGSNHGWFAGFAPVDAPKVAFAVVIEDLESGEHASTAACPVARTILATLQELGYLPGG